MAEAIKNSDAKGRSPAADLPLFGSVGYTPQAEADALIAA